LKIKVILNASPFYFGAMLCSYQPLHVFKTKTFIENASNMYYLVPKSQYPHQWIYPQDNKGFEMTLPFLLNKNWLNIRTLSEFTNMGRLQFDVASVLSSANGATSNTITFQIYAWMEDVELSGASVALALQSGKATIPQNKMKPNMEKAKSYGTTFSRYVYQQPDEYDGIISKPASAIASAFGCLTNIPVLGYYARATSIALNGVAGVASLFGLTNVPVIEDVKPVQPRNFPAFASSEIGFPVEKLTLDPKNELSIDPSISGDSPEDNMLIPYIVQKESLMEFGTWSTTDAADHIILSGYVNPFQFEKLTDATITSTDSIYAVPMSHIGQMFNNWRGDIIYRFKIICTKFHKGRLRLTYDPTGQVGSNIFNVQDNTNQVFNKIIDISEQTDIEVRIPYQVDKPWLYTLDYTASSQSSSSSSPTFNYDANYDNGIWCLQVLTELSAPIDVNTIAIQVFVRGAENLEFSNPRSIANARGPCNSMLAPQGGSTNILSEDYIEETSMNTTRSNVNPNRYLLNMGESILSLRTLLRRYSLNTVEGFNKNTTGNDYIVKNYSQVPKPYGYMTDGASLANKIKAASGTSTFNYSSNHPITWISNMYIGRRGSTFLSVNFAGMLPNHIRATRNPDYSVNNTYSYTKSQTPSNNYAAYRNYFAGFSSGPVAYLSDGATGQCVINGQTQSSINISMPHYSRFSFMSNELQYANNPNNSDESAYQTCTIEAYIPPGSVTTTFPIIMESHYAIGTDFSLIFFLNVPQVYNYNTYPTSA